MKTPKRTTSKPENKALERFKSSNEGITTKNSQITSQTPESNWNGTSKEEA